jgi:hypothetical protein
VNSIIKSNNTELILPASKILGDLDSDGDLDVVSSGNIHYNNSLNFGISNPFPDLFYNSSFCDFFNQNELSIFTTNPRELWPNIGSKVIKQNTNGFETIEDEKLYPVTVWADFDNDGLPEGFKINGLWGPSTFYLVELEKDTVYQKYAGNDETMKIYNPYINLYNRSEVADYDNDGDVDVLLISSYSGSYYSPFSPQYLFLLENQNGIFNCSPIPGQDSTFADTKAQWFDADADGDLDVLVSYNFCTDPYCEFRDMRLCVFENVNGTLGLVFADTAAVDRLENIQQKPVIFDYNNDGFLDFSYRENVRVKTETGYSLVPTTFNQAHSGLTDICTSVGDIDNDGDLDILGSNKLYINDVCNPPNT